MSVQRWYAAYALCAAAAALPFLATHRLPMADLPQHAVQVTIWRFFDNDCYRFFDAYELNWFNTYLLGYAAARLLATFLSVHAALKLLAYLAVVTLPLAARRVTLVAGLDPALALLAFPLGFGFAFYWGFQTFLLALPIAILLVLDSFNLDGSDAGRLMRVTAFSLVLVPSHALVFAASVGLGLLAHFLSSRESRHRWRGAAAIAAGLPLFVAWIVFSRSQEARAQIPTLWNLDWKRVLAFPQHLVSAGGELQALVFGLILLLLVVVTGVRPTRNPARIAVAGAAIAGYFFGPHGALGQIFLHERFASFTFIIALLALEAGRPVIRSELGRGLIVAACVMWMVVLSARFTRFHSDAEGFDRIVDTLPANARVLLLNVTAESDDVPGFPFLHFSGYYQARKGGRIGWSFSSNFTVVVRLKDRTSNAVPPVVTYDPRRFDWRRHSNFDYFVVRAPLDMSRLIFAGDADGVEFRSRHGMWWLYRHRDAAVPDRCSPLEASDPRSRRPMLSRIRGRS